MRSIFTIPVFAILLFSVTSARLADAQVQSSLNLMPVPANLQMGMGQLVVDASFSVAINGPRDPLLQGAVDRFLADLRRQAGMLALDMKVGDVSAATLVVSTEHPSKNVQALGEDESYSLEINASGAKVTAPTSLGAIHGLQTFLQLVVTNAESFAVPAVNIQDKPRFPWRGLMIDSPRHFHPDRGSQSQSGWHGGSEDERVSLALFRQPGTSRGEREVSPIMSPIRRSFRRRMCPQQVADGHLLTVSARSRQPPTHRVNSSLGRDSHSDPFATRQAGFKGPLAFFQSQARPVHPEENVVEKRA